MSTKLKIPKATIKFQKLMLRTELDLDASYLGLLLKMRRKDQS